MTSRDRTRRAFVLAAAASAVAGPAVLALAGQRERVVPMVARKWVFLPTTVQARKGQALVFQLSAPEVPMGFNLPDFHLRADVVPGRVATLKLVPDRTGTFIFLCDVFCGDGHETMNGELVVTA